MVRVFLYFIYYLYISLVYAFYLRRENKKIDCTICDQYDITFKNELWVGWFYNECYNYEKRKRDREKKNICLYYDKKLDIYKENFWKIWINCNCISEKNKNIKNSFSEEL